MISVRLFVGFWPLEHGETPGRGKLGATHKERARKVKPGKPGATRLSLLVNGNHAVSVAGDATFFQSPV
ncbi:hypothetical protein, partial [Mesorhizobium sp. M7A.F.Ca.CA.004.04.1.1]|uniref:hypothetical protein n=1 Tax=Mesorhizobium sp. M7A.F.Ca.CA.004.04.1.1 TaxID=2496733 RepID=UPI0019CF5D9C